MRLAALKKKAKFQSKMENQTNFNLNLFNSNLVKVSDRSRITLKKIDNLTNAGIFQYNSGIFSQ